MRGVVAALGWLRCHQFLEKLVDSAVRTAWTPGVRPIHKSTATACTAKAGHPLMNALARYLQRLRHLVDRLTMGALQYSKAPAVLPYIGSLVQRFP